MIAGTIGLAVAAAGGGALAAHFGWRHSATKSPTAIAESSRHPITVQDDGLFIQAPVGLCQLALDGRIVRANPTLQALCGFDEEQLSAYFLQNLICGDDIGVINIVLSDLVAGNGDNREMRSRLSHARGHGVWVHLAIQLVRSRGYPVHFTVAITDIGEYMLAEQIAQGEHAKFASIAAQVPVAVWLLSPEYQVLFANDALETLTGNTKENFFANPRCYFDLIHPDDVDAVSQAIRAFGTDGNYEVNYRITRAGGVRYVRQLGRGVYDANGKLLYSVASAMDISSEIIAREKLQELNNRLRETNVRLRQSVRLDGLTSCLNRVALFEEAEKSLLLARRYQRSSTVVFFDLNNFKQINDNFGHHVGDRALIAFAEQIKTRLRTTDELGRYGGDEFVALLRETDANQAMQLISTLPPVIVDNENGSSIILRFSAGVACSDDLEIETVDDWLRIADGLMYSQKVRLLKEGSNYG